jgi:hypothetical protein
MSASISHGMPPLCITTIAFVRGLILRATSVESRFMLSGSMSAKTGMAPSASTGMAVAQ